MSNTENIQPQTGGTAHTKKQPLMDGFMYVPEWDEATLRSAEGLFAQCLAQGVDLWVYSPSRPDSTLLDGKWGRTGAGYQQALNMHLGASKAAHVAVFQPGVDITPTFRSRVQAYFAAGDDVPFVIPMVLVHAQDGSYAEERNAQFWSFLVASDRDHKVDGVMRRQDMLDITSLCFHVVCLDRRKALKAGGLKPDFKHLALYEFCMRLAKKTASAPQVAAYYLASVTVDASHRLPWNGHMETISMLADGNNGLGRDELAFWLEAARRESEFDADKGRAAVKYDPSCRTIGTGL